MDDSLPPKTKPVPISTTGTPTIFRYVAFPKSQTIAPESDHRLGEKGGAMKKKGPNSGL